MTKICWAQIIIGVLGVIGLTSLAGLAAWYGNYHSAAGSSIFASLSLMSIFKGVRDLRMWRRLDSRRVGRAG